jgi:hypothetical protein
MLIVRRSGPAPAEAQKDPSDDFRQLLDEMDEILGEPTVPC